MATVNDRPGTLDLAGLYAANNAQEGTEIRAFVADLDGISGPVTYTFTDVTDAASPAVLQTGASDRYTPDYDSAGRKISVTASYTDDAGHPTTLTASAGTVADVDRRGTMTISGLVNGRAVVGQTMTVSVTDPDGQVVIDDTRVFTFDRDGYFVNGVYLGSSPSYTFTEADAGLFITGFASYGDGQDHRDSQNFDFGEVVHEGIPPETTIDAVSGVGANWTFGFGGTDNVGVVGYKITLDGEEQPTTDAAITFNGLDIGAHTLEVAAFDADGNVDPTPATYNWTVDPARVKFTIATSGGLTNKPIQSLSGTGEAGALVTLRDANGGGLIRTLRVGSDGNWSTRVKLNEGPQTVQATISNSRGNVTRGQVGFIIDTKRPTAPTVVLANDTGLSSTDNITSLAQLSVTPSELGGSLLYRLDNGAYLTTLPTDIADGKHNILVYERDAAGNQSASSKRLSFTLDTVAPDVSITPPPSVTSSTRQTITGTGEARSTIVLTEGGVEIGRTTVFANGTWRVATSLAGEGEHIIVATATDKAGNAKASDPVSITLETGSSLNRMVQAMAVAPSSASASSSPISAPQDQKHTLIAASHG